MSVLHDLLELGQHLRQEKLFVGMERDQLQKLYEEVRKIGEDLFHASWISRQQKLNLDHLQAMGHDVPSEEICAKNNQLESVNFQDSYKVLGHHDSKYGDLFKYLHENPVLLAHCVCALEKVNITTTTKVIGSIMSAIYGNCVVQEDEQHVLQLLKTLIDVQLGGHDNPRRLIRRGNCAFSLIFKQLSDMLFSTRLFLTAALHDPVMRLLMEDEWFYDIDPDKALVRFPPKERQKRFGEPGSDDYKLKVQNYRKFIVDKLVLLCTRFINSIKSNIHCFPASISWIVAQVFQTLTKGNKLSTGEVRATCADLIFALFICPAICDPEPYGITSDVPISHIARHNLMQMAQIVQVLAISQWDEIDPKLRDLYGRFEKGCMSSFLDCLVDGVGDEVPIMGISQFQSAARSTVLLTHPQLNLLVNCLRNTSAGIDDKVPGRKTLQELLVCLPSDMPQGQGHDNHLSAHGPTPLNPTPPGTPNNQKKIFRGLKKKNSLPNLQVSAEDGEATDGDSKTGEPIEDILVISLGVGTDCPGMMAENKILSWEQENRRRKVKYNTDISDGGPIEIHEKRTRFSLSHDQESIGNTSDYQEAISEAASSHSVDMENDNDNLSDMMSADVSGRGSPSISGRDTPLSQAGSVEERAPAEFAVPVPETVQKQNRVDVTERFGKFEIKAELERDETKSTVSDTWSTDVLASDSEPPEQNQLERLEEVAEEMGRPPPFLLAPRDADSDNAFPPSLSEMSETASDAWSTDVLASDTDEKQSELLTDLDQDDISMSSVMERSDNLDDQSLEDTPLASGGHSPSGDRDLLGFGAEGHSVKRADSLGSEEVFSEDVFADDITPSAETSQLNQTVEAAAADKLPKPEVKAEGQGQNRTSPDSRQSHGRTGNTESEHRQNATVTSKSDSLSLPKDHHCGARPKEFHKRSHHHHHHNRAHGGYNSAKVEAWAKSNGIGGNKDGPKFGAEFESISMARSAGGKPVNAQKLPTTTTINDQDIDEGIEISVDVNSLADQVEAVGLSEQQNVKFNENRLSATLSLFDPLSPENSSTGDLLEGAGGLSEHPVTTLPAAACPPACQPHPHFLPPRYSLYTAPSAQRATSEILISVSSSDEVQGQLQSSAETVKSTSQEDLRGGRRDSSDSSHSAASLRLNDTASSSKEASVDTLSMRSNGDNVSMRSDDKDFSENDEKGFDKINKKGFFKSVKEKIHKGIKRRTLKTDKELGAGGDSSFTEDSGKGAAEAEVDPKAESSFDILDKYRKKTPQDQQAEDQSELTDSAYQSQMKSKDEEEGPPFYDPSNLEGCFAFMDAKRKLRMVLSAGDFLGSTSLHQLMTSQPHSPREFDTGPKKDNDLISLLRAQLAEAINLQNKDVIAQLHEVIRCIRQFDNDGCKKLVKALREEYRSRSAYISYLIRCRQGLLMSHSYLQRLLNRIQRDKEICNKHMVNVCVRLFIERREKNVLYFISDFQKLTVADEKTDLVDRFLQVLYREMEQDSIWKAATENQLIDARLAVERLLMSRVYSHAMFPNGDGDFMRDQLFHQHLKKLSALITPTHKDLCIPRMYHFECPWPAAQREIYMINAYKTPKDKLQCVLRCSTTIMNLLSMANEKSVPAADDFIPVLIFVLIKANPPCLLSTIQYVNSFYESRLAGEEQYWWMQFSSAVEFIKTMDYST
ncbi:LOW QUALITY PROTEIN: GTPase-activating protein and VPS9 domain-containing protein 1-like [Haliotis rubra]|uniref:LOW QUALITY PROTEIN: GTPase-activating protein and VPS9 domain-containing protein 1-like n=1 Tax=Haliotis rubra TaxID=36100 RepID=UPI001EE57074|nr:LOW QUALITY PROTEIN: GTPase-activating protein and VPS9 domain-containing protein 1-like [Haliotis rubra]